MTYEYWPLFDLRLSTPDLTLRAMAEADLPAIAELLPDDVEMDPALPTYEFEDARLGRGIQSHQIYAAAAGGLAGQRPGRGRGHHRLRPLPACSDCPHDDFQPGSRS